MVRPAFLVSVVIALLAIGARGDAQSREGILLAIVQAPSRGHWLMTSLPTLRSMCMFAMGADWPIGFVQACG